MESNIQFWLLERRKLCTVQFLWRINMVENTTDGVLHQGDPRFRITPYQQMAAACTGALATSLISELSSFPITCCNEKVLKPLKNYRRFFCNSVSDIKVSSFLQWAYKLQIYGICWYLCLHSTLCLLSIFVPVSQQTWLMTVDGYIRLCSYPELLDSESSATSGVEKEIKNN